MLTAGKDPEVAATLIHLMLGPNTFFLSMKAEAAPPAPEPDEDFWTLFDLTDETAVEHAEELNYKVRSPPSFPPTHPPHGTPPHTAPIALTCGSPPVPT